MLQQMLRINYILTLSINKLIMRYKMSSLIFIGVAGALISEYGVEAHDCGNPEGCGGVT
jgi:hypothetical protein